MTDAANVLIEMSKTYKAKNSEYKDNYKVVGKIMGLLFPDGVPVELLSSDQFHLFELKIVKLTRFARSNMKHLDSIHDDGVYSAMIEGILRDE